MIDFTNAYIHDEPFVKRVDTFHSISEYTRAFFSEQSPLKALAEKMDRPYEERPQQTAMAIAVADAFSNHENLCIEAPTGVGKSFAYLIPAIYYAVESGNPVLISTETITLQEQLMHKDIPFLQSVMPKIPLNAALAKGRSNYLCLRRLFMTTSDRNILPAYVKQQEIDLILHWANTAQEGSLSDYPLERPTDALWHAVCSEAGNCLYPSCAYASKCFYWRARRSWNAANIIVTNHALLFTDLKIRLEGSDPLLPAYGALIVDEAHGIEDAAAAHLGINLSERGLNFSLNRLFEPEYARGLLALMKGAEGIELRDSVAKLKLSTAAYFDAMRNLCKSNSAEQNVAVDDNGNVMLESEKRLLQNVAVYDTLSDSLQAFAYKLAEVANFVREEDKNEDLATELMSQSVRFDCYANTIASFSQQSLKSHVYWLSRKDSSHAFLSLCSAPLNVADVLRQNLFNEEYPPVILTSATITVNNRFDHYKARIGYTGRAIALDSPFDFKRCLQIHIPKNIPDPTSEDFMHALPHALMFYLKKTNGAAFVLFTSYTMMRYAYTALQDFFKTTHMNAMMQGESLGRSQMLSLFKTTPNAILFGTSSFWTGVDVPGDALSNVIIVRLPFPVPSEPLIQARCEKIESQGHNAFTCYSLPESVIKLRQGAGRLIRTQNDSGILVILDNRIIKKNYGATFLKSLPQAPISYDTF